MSITLDNGENHVLSNGEVEYLLGKQSDEIRSLKEEIEELKRQMKEDADIEDDKPTISLEIGEDD